MNATARTNKATAAEKPVPPGDNRKAVATAIIAKARADCAELGLSPAEFADLLLPEALLAMMVEGMTQEEVGEAFGRFGRDEVAAWFLQLKRAVGYCDCEREAFAEHGAGCSHSRARGVRPIDFVSR